MAKELILLDTSVLIDYFRKKDKSKSYFSKLAANSNYEFAISVITEFLPIPQERIKKAIDERTEELKREMPKVLWD